jgi:ABC-type polysaccharide/polyol phosphate transport system ATPase subunit
MLILVGSVLALLLLLWLSRDEFKARKSEAKRYVDALEDPNYEEENKDEYIIELPDEKKTQEDGLYSEEDIVSEIGADTTTLSEEDLQIINMEERLPVDDRERVISVKDVTMEFHLSTYNPSGLKDYLIQMVKRNISYRRLYALYHVSFDVYKGEVIGIIGTNGSGKSTLLKIVSGALRPTSGSVTVDRKKVQLLTLGTGFDMELTARENVYLNGSIIGYSREFLDKHYDDIVKFAELEDFMEEKVKNFSSGMVSRLGFAIATAGDAAEILILDEVLSVGDEFFRKKSLARIKEMIHGGSTVLIVSHGMNTILDNCTRCVWIEKGELRMVGNPKEVCAAYRHMQDKEGALGA